MFDAKAIDYYRSITGWKFSVDDKRRPCVAELLQATFRADGLLALSMERGGKVKYIDPGPRPLA